MGRNKKNKTLISLKIDTELKEILDKKKYNKSALITALLWKYIGIQNNLSLLSNLNSLKNPIPQHYQCRALPLSHTQSGTERGFVHNVGLKNVYFKHKQAYITWLSKYSEGYRTAMLRALENLMPFVTGADKPKDLLSIIKAKGLDLQYSVKGIRSFVIYCEEADLLDSGAIQEYKRKIKNTIGVQIDTYVPQEHEIKELLKNTEGLENLAVKVFLETGCRATEFYQFVKTFDANKISVKDGVVAYPMFFRRHNKHSYYFFMTKSTFDLVVENIVELKEYSLEYLKNKIRYHNYLALKYLRKYNFSLMIGCEVNFKLANYIQGRSNKDVGFTHYLAKKELAIKEYVKVLPNLQQLSFESKLTVGENNG